VETSEIILGDCRQVLKKFEAESFDSMVTDPPAGIAFMGAEWDTHTLDGFEDFLTECFLEAYRVLKPGAHILVWSIPRTSYRTARAIERAGFIIRDGLDNIKDRSAEVEAFLGSLSEEQVELLLRAGPADSFILHMFGSGFPKSLNISKAIDKMKGAERKVVGPGTRQNRHGGGRDIKGGSFHGASDTEQDSYGHGVITEAATPEATQWEGFGTALKPAVETWWLARKPLQEKTVAEQVLATGTGAINIDGCRVAGDLSELINPGTGKPRSGMGSHYNDEGGFGGEAANPPHAGGRWPANVVLQHGPDCKETADNWECAPGCPVRALDEQSGEREVSGSAKLGKSSIRTTVKGTCFGEFGPSDTKCPNDTGGASRFFNNFEPDLEANPFFYTSKISASERKEDFDEGSLVNKHPTTKPKKLMRHLVRLVTPPGGRVLDPFCGSGSTVVAAIEEGMSGVGIEKENEFHTIATKRVTSTLGRIQDRLDKEGAFNLMFELESE
jgi:DNA modification methylase